MVDVASAFVLSGASSFAPSGATEDESEGRQCRSYNMLTVVGSVVPDSFVVDVASYFALAYASCFVGRVVQILQYVNSCWLCGTR